MEIPLQIAFHKAEHTDWAEDEIRERVDRLVKMNSAIVGCRVTVDQRAQNTEGTIPPVVRIELSMPGAAPIIVAYEPDRLQRKFQTPELGNAINDAFALAERQLAALKDARTGRPNEADHDSQNQFLGQVAELNLDEDYGFLLDKNGSLLYFHRNSVLSGDFQEFRRGDLVHYVEEMGDTGPLAAKVRSAHRTDTAPGEQA